MFQHIDWPEDLLKDEDALFVRPYNPEDFEHLQRTGRDENVLKDMFDAVSAKDPGLAVFENTVATVKTSTGLKGYAIGDDLIVLCGNIDKLEEARQVLEEQYTCHIASLESFRSFAAQIENTVVVPGQKPTIN